jgi:hypothetical protein
MRHAAWIVSASHDSQPGLNGVSAADASSSLAWVALELRICYAAWMPGFSGSAPHVSQPWIERCQCCACVTQPGLGGVWATHASRSLDCQCFSCLAAGLNGVSAAHASRSLAWGVIVLPLIGVCRWVTHHYGVVLVRRTCHAVGTERCWWLQMYHSAIDWSPLVVHACHAAVGCCARLHCLHVDQLIDCRMTGWYCCTFQASYRLRSGYVGVCTCAGQKITIPIDCSDAETEECTCVEVNNAWRFTSSLPIRLSGEVFCTE